MKKSEVAKIMAILSAFYGQGKSDPEIMATAWSYVLSPYDYRAAERAVLRFAENDTREYATFPAPGVIVALIKHEQGIYNRVFNALYHGKRYEELAEDEKRLIPENAYKAWQEKEPEEILAGKEILFGGMKRLEAGK